MSCYLSNMQISVDNGKLTLQNSHQLSMEAPRLLYIHIHYYIIHLLFVSTKDSLVTGTHNSVKIHTKFGTTRWNEHPLYERLTFLVGKSTVSNSSSMISCRRGLVIRLTSSIKNKKEEALHTKRPLHAFCVNIIIIHTILR